MNTSYFISKITYKLRCASTDLICNTPLKKWLLKERPGIVTLVYHGIDIDGNTQFNGRYLSASRFEEQIQYFKEHFNVIRISDIINDNIQKDRLNIAITFDDGYQNNLKLAIPILEKHQVPATFFITAINDTDYPMLWADYLDLASFIAQDDLLIEGVVYKKNKNEYYNSEGTSLKSICKKRSMAFKSKIYSAFPGVETELRNDSFSLYWKVLTNDELKLLDQSPMADIGLHGYYHDNLGILPHKEACQLILKSKKYLETQLGKSINYLAYPDVSYTRDLIGFAAKNGISMQFAADYLFDEDRQDERIFDRLIINPFVSLENQVRAILTGRY